MEFDAEIIEITTGEFQDNIVAIEPALMSLDQDPENPELITQIMRGLHSIKGGSGFLELKNLSSLAHGMENLLILANNEGLKLNSEHIDALFAGFSELQDMIADPFSSNDKDISTILTYFDKLTGKTKTPAKKAAVPTPAPAETEAQENQDGYFFNISAKEHQAVFPDNPHLYIVFLSSDQMTQAFNIDAWLVELKGFGYVYDHIYEPGKGILVLLSTALAPSLLLQVSQIPISVSAVSADLIDKTSEGDLKIHVKFNHTGAEILKPQEIESATPIFEQNISEKPQTPEEPTPAKAPVADSMKQLLAQEETHAEAPIAESMRRLLAEEGLAVEAPVADSMKQLAQEEPPAEAPVADSMKRLLEQADAPAEAPVADSMKRLLEQADAPAEAPVADSMKKLLEQDAPEEEITISTSSIHELEQELAKLKAKAGMDATSQNLDASMIQPEKAAGTQVQTPISSRKSIDEINAEIAAQPTHRETVRRNPDIRSVQQELVKTGETVISSPNVVAPSQTEVTATEAVSITKPVTPAAQPAVETTRVLPPEEAASNEVIRGRNISSSPVADETQRTAASVEQISQTESIAQATENLAPEAQMQNETPPEVEAKANVEENAQAAKTEKMLEKAQVSSSQSSSAQAANTVRVKVDRLDELVDLAGELVLARNQIMCFGKEIGSQAAGLDLVLRSLDRTTSKLQENIMTIRMQPVGNVFAKFPRMVRQVAKELGKKIELSIESNDVDLDKSMIELLGDPMTHIVRNVVDHGIELPEDRLQKGKSETGLMTMKAFYEGGQAIIQIIDDGKGIDPEKIGVLAVQKGVITQEECAQMSPQNKIDLIFKSGFSSSAKATMVSGRGVGMDVVKTNVLKIGGKVRIESVKGEGTTLTIVLPLTLAIMSALIIIDNQQRYAFPQANVKEIALLKEDDIERVEGDQQEMLKFRGVLLPLITLRAGLGLPKTPVNVPFLEEKSAEQKIIIVQSGAHQVAIQVDEILGNEEIVVKPMPEYLKNLQNFSGITILGDGTVSIIMDIMGFIEKNNLVEISEMPDNLVSNTKNIGQAQGTERLLLFHNGTEEIFGVFLPKISRVETIESSKIQLINQDEYIQCRDESMRVLRLEKHLPVGAPEHDIDEMRLVVPKETTAPTGILVHDILDTCEQFLSVETRHIPAEGVLGTALVNDKITIILDLEELLGSIDPQLVLKAEDEPEVPKQKKVLLAEDSPFFRLMEQRLIEAAGGVVTAVEDGKKALKLLQHENFDLVLTDIEMPEMDGWELINNIRANSKWDELQVIALTSLNSDQDKERGKIAGFTDWLVKMERDSLIEALTSYI